MVRSRRPMGADYQYRLHERSLTQRWLSAHAWHPLARRLPPRLTPNAITALGGAAMLLGLLSVRVGVGGDRWGYLGAAICTAVYLVADNVDGIHARRTGQCSRLGEFLDHGLDAVSGAILCWSSALCLGLTGAALFAYVGSVATTFFATMWDQHQTGVLHSERFGANEAILTCFGLFLLLFALPDGSWIRFRPDGLTLALVLVLFTVVGSLKSLATIALRVRARCWGLVPMLVSVVALWGLAVADQLGQYVAAALVLAVNVVLSGSLLALRLMRRPQRAREKPT